jgi:hypothetical protein
MDFGTFAEISSNAKDFVDLSVDYGVSKSYGQIHGNVRVRSGTSSTLAQLQG